MFRWLSDTTNGQKNIAIMWMGIFFIVLFFSIPVLIFAYATKIGFSNLPLDVWLGLVWFIANCVYFGVVFCLIIFKNHPFKWYLYVAGIGSTTFCIAYIDYLMSLIGN